MCGNCGCHHHCNGDNNTKQNHQQGCGCECNLKLEGFLIPCLLYLLAEEGPAHGYHLIEKLSKLPFLETVPDPAIVYRYLRTLENDAMIAANLEEGTRGPARKVFTLTPAGQAYLRDWIPVIKAKKDSLEQFLNWLNEI